MKLDKQRCGISTLVGHGQPGDHPPILRLGEDKVEAQMGQLRIAENILGTTRIEDRADLEARVQPQLDLPATYSQAAIAQLGQIRARRILGQRAHQCQARPVPRDQDGVAAPDPAVERIVWGHRPCLVQVIRAADRWQGPRAALDTNGDAVRVEPIFGRCWHGGP